MPSPAPKSPPPLPTPRFKWDDVALLMACHRERTLAGAARVLALDPATAGRRLSQLEDGLGVVLFHRGRDGLLPTAAMDAVLPAAEAAEVAMARFGQAVDGVETGVEGTVRVTMPPGVADALFVPLLPQLLARHPRLRLEIDASTRYVDLERREADLALRTQRPTQGDLVSVRLLDVPMAVMGAPERYLNAPPTTLGALPWIGYDHELAHLPEVRWVAAHARPDAVTVRTSGWSVQLGAARMGVGVVLTTRVQGQIAGLVPVPLVAADQAEVDALAPGTLWLVCPRSLREVPRVDAVWTFLRDAVAGLGM